MKALSTLAVSFLICCGSLFAQSTTGRISPLIKGTNAKINYITNKTVKLAIPETLSKYLAGIILANNIKSDTSSINNALNTWIKKYRELKLEINKVTDKPKRDKLLFALDQGDFITAEKGLTTKTSYRELSAVFPGTYQTTGDQSPIIIGDYGTVTYVVNEVITVGIEDENLVSNIMAEIKLKQSIIEKQANKLNTLNSLTIEIPSLGSTVRNYIASYKQIKAELAKSPSAVFKKANAYFLKGDYASVLKILNSSSNTSERDLAKINLLKAKILLLRFNFTSVDSTINEINKAFLIGVQIIPNAENNIEYGKFLIDFMSNYQGAIPYLEKNVDSVNDVQKKVELYNYLSISYAQADRVKSVNYLEKALTIITSIEPVTDSTGLIQKAGILFNLARAYSSSYFNPDLITKAINYTNIAIESVEKISNFNTYESHRKALFLNQNGTQFTLLGDTANAYRSFSAALNILENLYTGNPNKYAFDLSSVYYNLSGLCFNTFEYRKAIGFLDKVKAIVEPRASLNYRYFISLNMQTYTAYYANYNALKKNDSLKVILNRLNEFITPFAKADYNSFGYFQAATYADLGELYLAENIKDSAEHFITPAYNYFYDNINYIQFDKFKVSKALSLKNTLLIKKGELDEALNFNRLLLEKFNLLQGINKFNYEDFIPQINSQFAEVYLNKQEYANAISFSDKSLTTLYPKAQQYGVTYMEQLNSCILQACNIRLKQNNFDGADSIAKSYINGLLINNTVDPFVKEHMQGQVGGFISNIAVFFMKFADSVKPDTQRTITSLDLYPKIKKYFESADPHYSLAYSKNKNEAFRYTTFLVTQANFFDSLVKTCSDKMLQKTYTEEGCQIIQHAKQIASALPANPVTSELNDKISSMLLSCK